MTITLTKEQAEWLRRDISFRHVSDGTDECFKDCPGCQIATILEQAGAQRSEDASDNNSSLAR